MDTYSDLSSMPAEVYDIKTYVLEVRGVKYRVKTNLKPERFTDTRFFKTEQHLVDWLRYGGFAEVIDGNA
jgi:hypothetical protein